MTREPGQVIEIKSKKSEQSGIYHGCCAQLGTVTNLNPLTVVLDDGTEIVNPTVVGGG